MLLYAFSNHSWHVYLLEMHCQESYHPVIILLFWTVSTFTRHSGVTSMMISLLGRLLSQHSCMGVFLYSWIEESWILHHSIGEQRYSEVEYSGVFHVNDDEGMDYIGIVFGYQNNKKFYVAMWRRKNMNYLNTTYKAGIKGIQIKVFGDQFSIPILILTVKNGNFWLKSHNFDIWFCNKIDFSYNNKHYKQTS